MAVFREGWGDRSSPFSPSVVAGSGWLHTHRSYLGWKSKEKAKSRGPFQEEVWPLMADAPGIGKDGEPSVPEKCCQSPAFKSCRAFHGQHQFSLTWGKSPSSLFLPASVFLLRLWFTTSPLPAALSHPSYQGMRPLAASPLFLLPGTKVSVLRSLPPPPDYQTEQSFSTHSLFSLGQWALSMDVTRNSAEIWNQ